MSNLRITPGQTSRSVYVRIYKDTGYVNDTPLVYNSSNLSASYTRDNGSATSITLATLASATAAYSSGGFVHRGNGEYRLDLPDAALATGAKVVSIRFADATDIRAEPVVIQLDSRVDDYDTQLQRLDTAISVVKAKTDNLPSAAAGTTGGLGVCDADGNVKASILTYVDEDGTRIAAWDYLANLVNLGEYHNATPLAREATIVAGVQLSTNALVGGEQSLLLASQYTAPDNNSLITIGTTLGSIASLLTDQRPARRTDPASVIGLSSAARVLAAGATERCAFILCGNSNTVHNGYGHDSGLAYGLSQTHGLWGSGVIGPANGDSRGYHVSYGAGVSNFDSASQSGAPDAIESLYATLPTNNNGDRSNSYAYNSGGRLMGIFNVGDGTGVPPYVVPGQTLRFTGLFGNGMGGGNFYMRARQPDVGVYVTQGSTQSDAGTTPSEQAISYTFSVPSGTAYRFEVAFNQPWGDAGGTGPKLAGFAQVDNPAITSGWSVQTLVFRGGQPLKTQATSLVDASDTALAHYFTEVLRRLGTGKHVVFWINEGLNSQNDSTNSIGPTPAAGNTGAGWKDNITAMLPRIRTAYLNAGGVPGNLVFMLTADHAASDPDTAAIAAFRTAADELSVSESDVFAPRINNLYTAAEIDALGYLYNDEVAHLSSPTGYDAFGLKVARMILPSVGDEIEPLDAADIATIRDGLAQEATVNTYGTATSAALGSVATGVTSVGAAVEELAGQVGQPTPSNRTITINNRTITT